MAIAVVRIQVNTVEVDRCQCLAKPLESPLVNIKRSSLGEHDSKARPHVHKSVLPFLPDFFHFSRLAS